MGICAHESEVAVQFLHAGHVHVWIGINQSFSPSLPSLLSSYPPFLLPSSLPSFIHKNIHLHEQHCGY